MNDTSTQDLSPRRKRALLAAVMSGLLLAMLDQTIVGTALPQIVGAVGGEDLYLWVVTAYLVPATVSLPIYARLSDRHGRKPLLLIGMVLFLAGSALSALAQNMPELIAFRALQGLGAGALEALPFILVADLYQGRRNAALQGVLAGLMGLSFIGGPLIGGFLTDHVGWEAVFLVNLPIGLAALATVTKTLPRHLGKHEHGTPLDLKGIALLTAGLGLILVGLSERSHGQLPAWTEPHVGGFILAGLVTLAAFLRAERTAQAPIVPLHLLTDRTTGALLAAASVGTAGLYAGVFLLPRYFQGVEHVSATHSGLLVYPLLIGLLVAVNVAAMVIMRRLEYRMPLVIATALAGLGAIGFATFDAQTPRWESLVFMAFIGFGVGPMLSGLQIAMQRSVEPRNMAAAMGTLMLLRQVGGAVALAAAGTLYADGLQGGAGAAPATGQAVFAVTIAGAALAALALASLPRAATRIAPLPVPA
jgi:EmrB/QacA subfamily drug resistance transporter